MKFSLRDLIWCVLLLSALLGFAVEHYKRLQEQKVGIVLYDQDGRKYANFDDATDLDMGQINLDTDEVQISRIQVILQFTDE